MVTMGVAVCDDCRPQHVLTSARVPFDGNKEMLAKMQAIVTPTRISGLIYVFYSSADI